MDMSENRQIARDSLFVLVDLRVDGLEGEHRIKMRNLSSGGMMAEGAVHAARGSTVWVNLRNIGWIEGDVAWVHGSRFGIAFHEEIDTKLTRVPGSPEPGADMLWKPRSIRSQRSEGPLRKI